jgi:hypothetical protein
MKRIFEKPGERKNASVAITDTLGPNPDSTSINTADLMPLPAAGDATARVEMIQPAEIIVSVQHINNDA